MPMSERTSDLQSGMLSIPWEYLKNRRQQETQAEPTTINKTEYEICKVFGNGLTDVNSTCGIKTGPVRRKGVDIQSIIPIPNSAEIDNN